MSELIKRTAAGRLALLAEHLRIVMVGGPRQSGKTTLIQQYLSEAKGSYRTLDRTETLRAAQDDPVAFAEYGETPRGIDEVQLGGEELVRAIKLAVDADPRPGRFVLSGSSRFLSVPTISESLAGRMALIDLWPLSVAERVGAFPDFVARIFAEPSNLLADSAWTRAEYIEVITAGGFPEVLAIPPGIARRAWYDGYLQTVINRDIQSFAELTHTDAVARLLMLVAARTGGLTVVSDLAQALELTRVTTKRYLEYLDMVYLTRRLPAWSANLTGRIVKTPKTYLTDSGLAAHVLGVEARDLIEPGAPSLGAIVETFAATELFKAVSYSEVRAELFHVRTTDQNEVDFLLEGPGGKLVAIEVKASSSPGPDALRGLRWLRGRLKERLHAGILLHLGREAASRGDGIYSMPLSTLWRHRPLPS